MFTVFVRLMNPWNRESVYQTTTTISRIWSTTGIQSRTLTTLRHLFLSRALRRTLRTSCLDPDEIAHDVGWLVGALGMATPNGERPARDTPGTPDDRLDDAELVELVTGYLLDDGSPRHDQHPVAETGQLDGVAGLDEESRPGIGPRPQRPVYVEAGADVDTLGGLVGEDDRRLTEEGPRHRDLLLVAPGEELDRLLERWRADLELGDEVLDRLALGPPFEGSRKN